MDSDARHCPSPVASGIDRLQYQCALCHKLATGYGNSAEPLSRGRCCDDCNVQVVLTRLVEMTRERTAMPTRSPTPTRAA